MARGRISNLLGEITIVVVICFFGFPAQAKYDGGSGEPNNPYQISSVADWQELMATPADWDSHFVLTADIDLNDVPIAPVGNDPNWFTGVFDGNDYVIRNVDVNMPGSDYVGLFGCLGTTAEIKNLGVEDISIVGRIYVGSLLGHNAGTVSNCCSTGSVTGNVKVGGLVGDNVYGAISNCYSTGSVSGIEGCWVGGLVGNNWSYSFISNCYSTSSTCGKFYVGGLVGWNFGTISNCCSVGSVTGDDKVGGLVGSNYEDEGSITNCYSTGFVTSTGHSVGGLVGEEQSYITVTRAFWDVNTSGQTTSAGGVGKTTAEMQDINTFLGAGWDFLGETVNGTCNFWVMLGSGGYPVLAILNEYSPGEPSGSGTEADPYIIADANELGAVWYRPWAYYVMANDIDLVGIRWSGAIVPLFDGIFDGTEHTIRSAAIDSPGGDRVGLFGCLAANGQIKSLGTEGISVVARHAVGALVGLNAGTIRNSYSSGSVTGVYFVGGLVGYSVGNINKCHSSGSVSGTGPVGGLVGSGSTASITSCYSTSRVTGGSMAGGLLGHNAGTVSNCCSTGSVTGNNDVGGLVGANWGDDIMGCYSTGPVSASACVGGLVGSNHSTIINSYSCGSVAGNDTVGGLVGENIYATISKCYSIGVVSSAGYNVGGLLGDNATGAVGASFWDVNTSGWTTSRGGTPKTTAEMKTQTTFTSAGWDFLGETANGTEDIWAICEGTNYPRFVYQIPTGDIVCPDGVNFIDYSFFVSYWLEENCGSSNDCEGTDLDLLGTVDINDLRLFVDNWLRGL